MTARLCVEATAQSISVSGRIMRSGFLLTSSRCHHAGCATIHHVRRRRSPVDCLCFSVGSLRISKFESRMGAWVRRVSGMLAERRRSSEEWAAHPRAVAAGGPLQRFHHRGIESIWRRHREQRPTNSGTCQPLRMISRMRVMSLPRTVTSADHIMRATIDTYFAPNKIIRELHDLTKNGKIPRRPALRNRLWKSERAAGFCHSLSA